MTMMRWIVVAALGCAMAASAQTAKVVQLTPDEAKQAKALYDQQQELTKVTEQFRAALRDKYLKRPPDPPQPKVTVGSFSLCGVSLCPANYSPSPYKAGWESGEYIYTDDFKFLVPKPYQNGSSSYGSSNYGSIIGCPTTYVNTAPTVVGPAQQGVTQ